MGYAAMPIRVIAHRGASAHEPENTIRAFLRAAELGADLVELDVHLSADGVPMVIHDAHLERSTDGRGLVAQWTREDLQRLDAGGGERIPTLAEVLEAVRGRLGLYIELKAPGTPAAVVEALRRARPGEEVVCGSFQAPLVRELGALAPELPAALLIPATMDDPVTPALAVGARFTHLCWERKAPEPHRLLTPDLLFRCRRAGLEVVIWHEERPEELREIVKQPVWGICSNNPERVVAALMANEQSWGKRGVCSGRA